MSWVSFLFCCFCLCVCGAAPRWGGRLPPRSRRSCWCGGWGGKRITLERGVSGFFYLASPHPRFPPPPLAPRAAPVSRHTPFPLTHGGGRASSLLPSTRQTPPTRPRAPPSAPALPPLPPPIPPTHLSSCFPPAAVSWSRARAARLAPTWCARSPRRSAASRHRSRLSRFAPIGCSWSTR